MSNIRLIINTANLQIGGAMQRSISFLNELKEFGKDDYHVFCIKSVAEQLDIGSFPANFIFYHFNQTPANIKTRRTVIRKMNKYEEQINPDIVFSFVGPAYWKPKAKHLVGYGIPHIVYNELDSVKKLPLKSKLEMIYKKFWTKYEADYFVVQTEDVKKRLANIINVNENIIYLVTNGIGIQYKDVRVKKTNNNIKKLLLISRYRPSKNFEIINDVIAVLGNKGFNFEFHITIEEDIYNNLFNTNKDWVINHGPVKAADCPALYNECDAMFLPTHLECFSASYPEAMKMEKPILTSDLSFAHTVCEDAALYFDNIDAEDIANKIINLFSDTELYSKLINRGKKRLHLFQDSRSQAESYLKICNEIVEK